MNCRQPVVSQRITAFASHSPQSSMSSPSQWPLPEQGVRFLTPAFMVTKLARHPEHQAWAADEVLALDGEPDADTPLPRLDAVLDECMRLHPPAPAFAREPTEDIELGGHTIPAGTTLMLAPFILHRSDRFFEDPSTWDPRRWTPEMRAALPRFAFYPFGGGPRVCIGAAMARVEARLALVAILRRFRVEAPPGARLRLVPSVTLRPAEPVRLKFVAR